MYTDIIEIVGKEGKELSQHILEEKKDLTLENLSRYIMDLSIDVSERIEYMNMYYTKNGDDVIETVNRLGTMYEMSNTKLLREYLYDICVKSELSPFIKSLCARYLCSHPYDDSGQKAIDHIIPKLTINEGTPYRIELLKLLMAKPSFRERTVFHLCNIVNDVILDSAYRFKIILGFEYLKDEVKDLQYYLSEAYYTYIQNSKNSIEYRILSGQILLKNISGVSVSNQVQSDKSSNQIQTDNKSTKQIQTDKSSNQIQTNTVDIPNRLNKIQGILLEFAENKDVEYNRRADSADILLSFGTDEYKEKAKSIIYTLGRGEGVTNRKNITIYDNAQNVHSKEVENSVLEAIEFLYSFEIAKIENKEITFDYVENKIKEFLSETDKEEKYNRKLINCSLDRIFMDRAVYSKYHCTLIHILLRIWTYISGNKNEFEIKKRLIEELVDMSGTCSSGFASRLINTISGFGDFSMKVSWRDQIVANFSGRLNKRIKDLDDLLLQEQVLDEMTLNTTEYESRKHFLKFLRENISDIREELYQEFKTHITDTDFDLYFRSALSSYESNSS